MWLSVFVATVAVVVVGIGRWSTLWRAHLYDAAISSMTTVWYREVLLRLKEHSSLLDVGIGTGKALMANAHLLTEKHVTVVGVDYDGDYVVRCRDLIQNHNMQESCQVLLYLSFSNILIVNAVVSNIHV